MSGQNDNGGINLPTVLVRNLPPDQLEGMLAFMYQVRQQSREEAQQEMEHGRARDRERIRELEEHVEEQQRELEQRQLDIVSLQEELKHLADAGTRGPLSEITKTPREILQDHIEVIDHCLFQLQTCNGMRMFTWRPSYYQDRGRVITCSCGSKNLVAILTIRLQSLRQLLDDDVPRRTLRNEWYDGPEEYSSATGVTLAAKSMCIMDNSQLQDHGFQVCVTRAQIVSPVDIKAHTSSGSFVLKADKPMPIDGRWNGLTEFVIEGEEGLQLDATVFESEGIFNRFFESGDHKFFNTIAATPSGQPTNFFADVIMPKLKALCGDPYVMTDANPGGASIANSLARSCRVKVIGMIGDRRLVSDFGARSKALTVNQKKYATPKAAANFMSYGAYTGLWRLDSGYDDETICKRRRAVIELWYRTLVDQVSFDVETVPDSEFRAFMRFAYENAF